MDFGFQEEEEKRECSQLCETQESARTKDRNVDYDECNFIENNEHSLSTDLIKRFDCFEFYFISVFLF